jgi:hypothetical protein
MQTFLPYEAFWDSANVLDKKRCWKQVVEAHQILGALKLIKAKYPPVGIPWVNHPAVRMWEGYINPLKYYFNCFLDVSINKHGINTKYVPYTSVDKVMDKGSSGKWDWPWWLGNEDFHRAMRARLIEKDRDFYLPLFPEDEGFNEGKYFWPVMDGTKTFKII